MQDIIDKLLEDAVREFLAKPRGADGSAFRISDAVAATVDKLAPLELITLAGELIRRNATVSRHLAASEVRTEHGTSTSDDVSLAALIDFAVKEAITRILSEKAELTAEENNRLRNARRRNKAGTTQAATPAN